MCVCCCNSQREFSTWIHWEIEKLFSERIYALRGLAGRLVENNAACALNNMQGGEQKKLLLFPPIAIHPHSNNGQFISAFLLGSDTHQFTGDFQIFVLRHWHLQSSQYTPVKH
jgi:hypothetical protein